MDLFIDVRIYTYVLILKYGISILIQLTSYMKIGGINEINPRVVSTTVGDKCNSITCV